MAGGPYNPNPMGGPPMGMPPQGQPGAPMPPQSAPMQAQPQPRPVKRGTSKAVPIVVSAGLAIGTFCGLLFGLGTGDVVAAVPSHATNADKLVAEVDPKASPADFKPVDKPKSTTPPPASGSGSAAPAAGSGSAAAGSGSAAAGSGSAAPAAAPAVKAKVTIGLNPDTAMKAAVITVDGTEIKDGVTELTLDAGQPKKSVKIVVKSPGFKDTEKTIEIDGDTKIDMDLVKGKSSLGAPAATPAVASTTPPAQTPAKQDPPKQASAQPPAKQDPPKQTPPKQTPRQTPPKQNPPKKTTLIDI